VTVAASNLQKADLIRYRRGKLAVLDRRGLEAASCGCYTVADGEPDGVINIEGKGMA